MFLQALFIHSFQNINMDMIFHAKTKDISVPVSDPKLWYNIQWFSVTFEPDPHLNNVGVPKCSWYKTLLRAKKACSKVLKQEATVRVCNDLSDFFSLAICERYSGK